MSIFHLWVTPPSQGSYLLVIYTCCVGILITCAKNRYLSIKFKSKSQAVPLQRLSNQQFVTVNLGDTEGKTSSSTTTTPSAGSRQISPRPPSLSPERRATIIAEEERHFTFEQAPSDGLEEVEFNLCRIRDRINRIFAVLCFVGCLFLLASLIMESFLSRSCVSDSNMFETSDTLTDVELAVCRASGFLTHFTFAGLDYFVVLTAIVNGRILFVDKPFEFPYIWICITEVCALIETVTWIVVPVEPHLTEAFIVFSVWKGLAGIMACSVLLFTVRAHLTDKRDVLRYMFAYLGIFTTTAMFAINSSRPIFNITTSIHILSLALFLRSRF